MTDVIDEGEEEAAPCLFVPPLLLGMKIFFNASDEKALELCDDYVLYVISWSTKVNGLINTWVNFEEAFSAAKKLLQIWDWNLEEPNDEISCKEQVDVGKKAGGI